VGVAAAAVVGVVAAVVEVHDDWHWLSAGIIRMD